MTATTELSAIMPTVEFAALPTTPLPRVDARCAYCGIRLSAIPDRPVPVLADSGRTRYVHEPCVEPFRITRDRDRVGCQLRGTSDPSVQ